MNAWEFASGSPWLAFFVSCLAAFVLSAAGNCAFRCWNRLMRCLTILKHGWPPPHCDADGDLAPPHSEEPK